MNAAAQLVGLDPYLGFFHTVQYGRPSLVLDLMEEFRPLIVDPLVVEMTNRDVIGKQDFAKGPGAERPIVLSDQAVKRVIEQYEQRATALVKYPFTGEQTSYRRCLELQTRQMARVVKGEAKAYHAMINDNDKMTGWRGHRWSAGASVIMIAVISREAMIRSMAGRARPMTSYVDQLPTD